MKIYFFLLCLLGTLTAMAQQQQEELRSNSQLVFPEFREGRVLQSFGRSVKAKVNILYRNAALCYLDTTDNKIKQATNNSIWGVEIDSIRYVKVKDQRMGRVLAEQAGKQLLCVTTIDLPRYKELTMGGVDMPFFEIDMGGFGYDQFMDLSNNEQASNKGYPLKREYYFMLEGEAVPANFKMLKDHVKPELRTAFKRQTEDQWWSWKDDKSLEKLLMFLK